MNQFSSRKEKYEASYIQWLVVVCKRFFTLPWTGKKAFFNWVKSTFAGICMLSFWFFILITFPISIPLGTFIVRRNFLSNNKKYFDRGLGARKKK